MTLTTLREWWDQLPPAEQRAKLAAKARKYRAATVTTDEMRRQGAERMREWNAKWKADAHAILGGICKRCGFADSRALQIDHVHGDGFTEKKERRRLGSMGAYHKRVVDAASSGRYQLLCANCNWIKRAENGEHGGEYGKQRGKKC